MQIYINSKYKNSKYKNNLINKIEVNYYAQHNGNQT